MLVIGLGSASPRSAPCTRADRPAPRPRGPPAPPPAPGRRALLLAAVSATTVLLAGDPFGELTAWLQLLAGYDVAMLLAGGLTYGLALEE